MLKKNHLTLFILLCGVFGYLGCSEDSVQFEWRQVESGTSQHLYAIHFSDTKHGWAVGTAGTILSTADGGMTWRAASESKDTFTAVNFATPNNGWLTSIGKVLYTGSSGGSWRIQHQVRAVGTRPPGILDMHFISTAEGWAVGGSGTVLHTTDGGNRWESQSNLSKTHLWGVHFVDANNGWIVGGGGENEDAEILHTRNGGKQWVRQRSHTSDEFLFAVYFANPTHGWIVGSDGLILHTNDGGRTWLRQKSTVDRALRTVAFRDPTHGWAVGEKGLILQTTDGGQTWSHYPAPVQHNLQDIYLNKGTGWIVGAKGTILRGH